MRNTENEGWRKGGREVGKEGEGEVGKEGRGVVPLHFQFDLSPRMDESTLTAASVMCV